MIISRHRQSTKTKEVYHVEHKSIVFNACTHTESIKMKFRDFERLAKPMIADLAESAHNNVTEPIT